MNSPVITTKRKYGSRKKTVKAALTIIIAALVLSLTAMGAAALKSKISARFEAERAYSLKEAVERAARQCYAVEGVYPRTLEYLEEHYGLLINRDRYIVSYDCSGSNVMPYVMVLNR